MPRKMLFPPEVLDFFRDNNKGRSAQEMTDLLNATFGTSYTREQIKACRARQHWDSGLRGYFERGHVPHNKGKKGISYPGTEATQFKKGHTPLNHKPVGSERITRDGYHEVKTAEPNEWRAVHVLNWERVHGPVPPGHCLIFKDRNKDNCEVGNLLLVSRGELAVMNKRGLITENPEATEAGQNIAKLIKAMNTAKKTRRRNTTKKCNKTPQKNEVTP